MDSLFNGVCSSKRLVKAHNTNNVCVIFVFRHRCIKYFVNNNSVYYSLVIFGANLESTGFCVPLYIGTISIDAILLLAQ